MLRDVISSLNLSIFPEIALALFLLVFAAIAIRTYRSIDRARDRQLSSMPLANSNPATTLSEESHS